MNSIKQAVIATALAIGSLAVASGTASAFNPQPEPPTKPSVSVQSQTTSPRSIGGFSPTSPKVATGGVRGCDGSV